MHYRSLYTSICSHAHLQYCWNFTFHRECSPSIHGFSFKSVLKNSLYRKDVAFWVRENSHKPTGGRENKSGKLRVGRGRRYAALTGIHGVKCASTRAPRLLDGVVVGPSTQLVTRHSQLIQAAVNSSSTRWCNCVQSELLIYRGCKVILWCLLACCN